MAVEPILSEEAIHIIQWGTGIIGFLIAALATIYTRLIMSTIKGCNSSLKEEIKAVKDYAHETRDLVTKSQDTFLNHVITHHTRKDP